MPFGVIPSDYDVTSVTVFFSREDSDAAFLRHYTRYTRLSRFTAALVLILATVMLVVVGGVVFWV